MTNLSEIQPHTCLECVTIGSKCEDCAQFEAQLKQSADYLKAAIGSPQENFMRELVASRLAVRVVTEIVTHPN